MAHSTLDISTPKSMDYQLTSTPTSADPQRLAGPTISSSASALKFMPAPMPLPSSELPTSNGTKAFNLLDLELIHHWSTKTYMTMSSRFASHVVWRDTIFAEALRHDFVLQSIIATSALHKATLLPKSSEAYAEYSKVALAYQDLALARFIPAVSKPSEENGIALFALSLFLTVWAFASRRLPEGLNNVRLELSHGDSPPGIFCAPHTPTAQFIEIVMIVRGVYAVIKETDKWLQGNIEELLRYPRNEELPQHSPDVLEAFDTLQRAVEDSQRLPVGDEGQILRELYLTQLQALRDISRCRTVVEWDGHIFSWIIMAPPAFINCLMQGQPMALAIFAYWAAILRCMDHHWWATGWPYILVADLVNVLDSTWDTVLDWPKKQVGLKFQSTPAFESRRLG
ncbi:hypothetical protein LTR84_006908 [Exophiala bonariae]|uniref:Transcription factor domain-containing protein n=1 Tax=Exophiala bonariae TaxID=1690606 RepID=A0AAV9N3L7_9EURO|nr:hypothetical protein LTR84_006908 [Exophiala bonariae]